MHRFCMLFYSSDQSIGSIPFWIRKLFTFEKWRHPKKPLNAESGEGWAHWKIPCLGFVISPDFDLAFPPQRIKAIGFSRSFSFFIIESVSCSQPFPLWLFACPCLTVRTVFKSKTPCFVHGISSPLLGGTTP